MTKQDQTSTQETQELTAPTEAPGQKKNSSVTKWIAGLLAAAIIVALMAAQGCTGTSPTPSARGSLASEIGSQPSNVLTAKDVETLIPEMKLEGFDTTTEVENLEIEVKDEKVVVVEKVKGTSAERAERAAVRSSALANSLSSRAKKVVWVEVNKKNKVVAAVENTTQKPATGTTAKELIENSEAHVVNEKAASELKVDTEHGTTPTDTKGEKFAEGATVGETLVVEPAEEPQEEEKKEEIKEEKKEEAKKDEKKETSSTSESSSSKSNSSSSSKGSRPDSNSSSKSTNSNSSSSSKSSGSGSSSSSSSSAKKKVWVVDQAAWDEQVLVQAAWDEQVLVQAAWDETVNDGGYWRASDGFTTGDGNVMADYVLEHDVSYSWVQNTKTINHPAKYKTVHHDAQYKTVHHDEVGHWEER